MKSTLVTRNPECSTVKGKALHNIIQTTDKDGRVWYSCEVCGACFFNMDPIRNESKAAHATANTPVFSSHHEAALVLP